jgi:hypothetical protein
LGGLGAAEGPPASVVWTPVFGLWGFLPWLILLPLMLLPRNRTGSAWLVVLVLVGESMALAVLSNSLNGPLGSATDDLAGFFTTQAVGLAAAWLAASYLTQKPRWLSALVMLLAMLGTGVLGTVAMSIEKGEISSFIPFAIGMLFLAANTALAWLLASLCCRRRFGVGRFTGWLAFWTFATWLISVGPFLLFAAFSSGSGMTKTILLQGTAMILAVAACATLMILGFLAASGLAASLRHRWEALAGHQPTPVVPPIIAPPAVG